ncbi:MAG: peptidase, partial [Proteobacteria bacterium]|nr:peptidase [Pseudomonadota bacterium]
NLDSHDSEQQGNSSSGEQMGETEESENDQQESPQSQQSQQPEESSGNSSGNQTIPDLSSQEPEVRTADALREKIESLVSSDNRDNVYVELPHLNLETIIAKNSEIHQYIDENFERQKKYIDANNDTTHNFDLYEEVDRSYKQFKTSAQKEVNYLVKEFECRKAADSYARTSTARTGVLDTARLHTYKYNEDLFKKINVIPDGKNHGLIFILDWSGSMNEVIQDTCKQLFNLIWFCKKVSIPFEVYAFTNEWRSPKTSQEVYSSHYEKREGLIYVADDFSLLNLLTSKVNMKTLEHQMLNIWRLTIALRNPYGFGCRYVAPTRLYLSSTPLNEALIALHQILPNFQRENKLQKVQCVVLTDGEANCLPYHIEVKRNSESEPYIGVRGISPGQTFLRDRKIGTTYKFEYEYHKFTEVLISNLKDKFPTVNMIGIRVLQNRDTSNFVSLYYNKLSPQYNKILSDWKKNRSLNILESSYDAYFGLSASTLSQDSEFEVAEDATKSQIKSAFVKSLKIKKLNKKVLGQFMELVV